GGVLRSEPCGTLFRVVGGISGVVAIGSRTSSVNSALMSPGAVTGWLTFFPRSDSFLDAGGEGSLGCKVCLGRSVAGASGSSLDSIAGGAGGRVRLPAGAGGRRLT